MKRYIERLLELSGVPSDEFCMYDEEIVDTEFTWISNNLLRNPIYHDIFIDYYENGLTSIELTKKYPGFNTPMWRLIRSIDRALSRHNITYSYACMDENPYKIEGLMLPPKAFKLIRDHFEDLIELREYMKATYCFSTYAFVPRNLDWFMNMFVHDSKTYVRNVKNHSMLSVYSSTRKNITNRMVYLFPELKDYDTMPKGAYAISRLCGASSIEHIYHNIPKPFPKYDPILEELMYTFIGTIDDYDVVNVLQHRYLGHEIDPNINRSDSDLLYRTERAKVKIRSGNNTILFVNALQYSTAVYPLNVIQCLFGKVFLEDSDKITKVHMFMEKLTKEGYTDPAQQIIKIHTTLELRDELWSIVK